MRYGDNSPFTVYLPDGSSRTFDDEEAEFEVQDSGVLEVTQRYSGPLYFGPTGWLRVEPAGRGRAYDVTESVR
jgi:hypothetical protein